MSECSDEILGLLDERTRQKTKFHQSTLWPVSETFLNHTFIQSNTQNIRHLLHLADLHEKGELRLPPKLLKVLSEVTNLLKRRSGESRLPVRGGHCDACRSRTVGLLAGAFFGFLWHYSVTSLHQII